MNYEDEDYYDGLTNDPDNNPYMHSPNRQFCANDTCPCREDQGRINDLNGHVLEGLASAQDANNIYRGRIV